MFFEYMNKSLDFYLIGKKTFFFEKMHAVFYFKTNMDNAKEKN